MKKSVCLLLALLLVLSLCACGDGGGGETAPPEQERPEIELPQTVWERTWVSSPVNGEQKVKISPEGSCEIQGVERSYTVVSISDSEVVLDAEGVELRITLNPQGISELHVGSNWDEHYVKYLEYWNIIYKSWTSENRECIEIFPSGISMSKGFYPEFRYDTYNDVIEVMEAGQVIYTIINGYSQLRVTDADGNETLYTREVDYMEPGTIDDPTEEPMDEEVRLGLAYEKALNDFNAAISNQPVYDDEGKEITSGPALAEYLYNQFAALGDYEDASFYLTFFKTRTETVATVRWYQYIGEEWGGDRETVYDEEVPAYDLFGRLCNNNSNVLGISYSCPGNERYTSVYDENENVTQVIITSTNGFGEVIGTCVANFEYNDLGQHIATHVAFVDEEGNDVRYTSTFQYDSKGRLIRYDIPYGESHGHDTTLTYQYLYDEYDRCIQSSMVEAWVDESVYEYYHQPASKIVYQYFYDENGMQIRVIAEERNPFDGGGNLVCEYTYDDNQCLIKRVLSSKDQKWENVVEEYGREESTRISEQIRESLFHPGVSVSEATQEDWFSMEPVDLTMWDWIPHTIEPSEERTYTYDKTVTIMYIDLTPED